MRKVIDAALPGPMASPLRKRSPVQDEEFTIEPEELEAVDALGADPDNLSRELSKLPWEFTLTKDARSEWAAMDGPFK